MSESEFGFLVPVVSALALFAGALSLASWEESCRRCKSRQ